MYTTRYGNVYQFCKPKIFYAELKLVDELLTGTKITGAGVLFSRKSQFTATNSVLEHEPVYIPERQVVTLIVLYGHMLSAGKSYASELFYFLLANHLVPDDPVICLSAATAYLYRAMQRQSENRHLQILQAMFFFAKIPES